MSRPRLAPAPAPTAETAGNSGVPLRPFLAPGRAVTGAAVPPGDNALQTVLAVRRGMTANILDIVASAYVILEGVMLAQWLKERDQRKEREAVKLNQQWQSWYERQQAAFREGRPFDEPPPAGPGAGPHSRNGR